MKLSAKAKERIAVAKDVLKSLTGMKVKESNGYVMYNKGSLDKVFALNDSKKIACELKKKCTVCAKGAMLLSYVGMVNSFDFEKSKFNWLSDNEYEVEYVKLMKKLQKIFSVKQLDLIEAAFEGYDVFLRVDENGDDVYDKSSINFHNKYSNDKIRLQRIMENIVVNKGTFVL